MSVARLSIELADKSARTRVVARAMLAAGTLGLAASCGWYAHESAELQAVQAQLDRHARLVRRTPSAIASAKDKAPDLEREVRAANAVIAQLTVPWDRLFTGLASTASREVALLAVRPDAASGQVVLKGEARTLKNMLAYTRRLERSETLSDVVLLAHETRAAEPESPVSFSIAAAWKAPL